MGQGKKEMRREAKVKVCWVSNPKFPHTHGHTHTRKAERKAFRKFPHALASLFVCLCLSTQKTVEGGRESERKHTKFAGIHNAGMQQSGKYRKREKIHRFQALTHRAYTCSAVASAIPAPNHLLHVQQNNNSWKKVTRKSLCKSETAGWANYSYVLHSQLQRASRLSFSVSLLRSACTAWRLPAVLFIKRAKN